MDATAPNILVFMTDQQRADVIDPSHPCRTPHAERLMKEGLHFREAYTPSPHCCPSRATFMTGVVPSRHGVYNNVNTPTAIHRGVYPGVPMFSQRLQDARYQLSYTGKWHVSSLEDPVERGWNELLVTATKGNYTHRRPLNFEKMMKDVDAPRRRGWVKRPGWGDIKVYGSNPVPEELRDRPWEAHNDYPIVEQALQELPRLAAAAQPWCLYVGTNGPHDPFIVPEPYAKLYDPKTIELPPNYRDTLDDKPRIYQRMRKQYWDQLSEDEIRESIAHYWGYCSMQDDYLGLLLDALEKTGQAENTLVIFMSDHGEYLGAHGLYCKGVPSFREGYHIPCVMRWPNGIKNPGRVVDEFVSLEDFAPTFTDLAGAQDLGPVTGRSLKPFMEHQTPGDWRDARFTQMNGVELYYTQRAVQTKAHKYVYNGFDFDELYDLEKDPHEMKNLVDDPGYRDIKQDLCRRMWRFAEEQQDHMLFNPYWTVAMAPWGPADALA